MGITLWELVVCHTDVEGFKSVMPAKAGIQGDSALASSYTSWILGLALLARNDMPAVYPSSLLWWPTRLWKLDLRHGKLTTDKGVIQ